MTRSDPPPPRDETRFIVVLPDGYGWRGDALMPPSIVRDHPASLLTFTSAQDADRAMPALLRKRGAKVVAVNVVLRPAPLDPPAREETTPARTIAEWLRGVARGDCQPPAFLSTIAIPKEWMEVAADHLDALGVTSMPHGTPDGCPTYYDGCHCTVENLETIANDNKRLRAEVTRLTAERDRAKADLADWHRRRMESDAMWKERTTEAEQRAEQAERERDEARRERDDWKVLYAHKSDIKRGQIMKSPWIVTVGSDSWRKVYGVFPSYDAAVNWAKDNGWVDAESREVAPIHAIPSSVPSRETQCMVQEPLSMDETLNALNGCDAYHLTEFDAQSAAHHLTRLEAERQALVRQVEMLTTQLAGSRGLRKEAESRITALHTSLAGLRERVEALIDEMAVFARNEHDHADRHPADKAARVRAGVWYAASCSLLALLPDPQTPVKGADE